MLMLICDSWEGRPLSDSLMICVISADCNHITDIFFSASFSFHGKQNIDDHQLEQTIVQTMAAALQDKEFQPDIRHSLVQWDYHLVKNKIYLDFDCFDWW